MFVKPAAGVKVRDPISRLHLPEEGREVPEDTYWTRRLAGGDVVRASPVDETITDVVPVAQIPDSNDEDS